MKVTWEPASSLPETVVSAFNSGEECRPVEQKSQQYGQEACTLSVESNPVDSQPLKKSRKDRPVIESNDGYVEFAMVNLHAHRNMHIITCIMQNF